MNYIQLQQAIQDYAETTEQLFVANIPTFVIQAETRIYNTVQIPSLRRNVTGALTTGNQYLSLPNDWLATYSVAVVDTAGNYNYLLNKDVNYIRQAYPNPNQTGLPYQYAVFGSQYTDINELSLIVGPVPDQNYVVELHYFYYPPTIVQGQINALSAIVAGGTLYVPGVYSNVPLINGSGSGATATIVVGISGIVTNVTLANGGQFYVVGDVLTVNASSLGGSGSGFTINVASISNAAGTSWLGDNYEPALFYGAMREAMIFQKQEADIIKEYEDKYQEAMGQLKRLGDGLDRGDAYRDGQTKLMVKT